MRVTIRLALTLAILAAPLAAQTQKKPLTQADWDRWRSIQGATLSPDGKWVAYTLSPQVGDGEFVVRSTTGTTEYRLNVGYISRPNNNPGGAARAGGGGGGGGGARGGGGGGGTGGPFTTDSKYAFVSTQQTKAQFDSAAAAQAAARGGRAGGGGGAGGRGATGGATAAAPAAQGGGAANRSVIQMISLADGKITPMTEWRSYRITASPKWMVYTTSEDTTGADSTGRGGGGARAGGAGGGGGAGRAGGGGGRGGAGATRLATGNAIFLRNMLTGTDEKIDDIVSYTFDDSVRVMAYVIGSRDSTKNGLYLRDMATGAVRTVLSGPGNYRSFAFDDSQAQFIFASDRDQLGRDSAQVTYYLGNLKAGTAQPVLTPAMMPSGFRMPASVSLNRSVTALTFSLSLPPISVVPAESLVGKANFDLWHWQDPQLQPQQKLQVNQARNRSYQNIYYLATKKLVQITNDSFPSVSLSDDGLKGLSNNGTAYTIERMWESEGSDLYYVDPVSGNKKLLRKKISGSGSFSPDAQYVIFFDKGHWFTYNIASGKEVNITAPAKGVRFDQETFSTPGTPSAWGVAGWTKADSTVLIYDRFDIWELDPAGVRAPIVVTDSVGRKENITFRISNFEREPGARYYDTKPMFLTAFDEDTKASGFYRDRLGTKALPEKVMMADMRLGAPTKARNAEVYMMTKSTFVEFPNLWVGPTLTNTTKITDANPWQKDYNWGTAELVNWLSSDGIPLQGILYKPENFDPTKKYPMVSYFYEDLSDGLHGYVAPNGRNTVNPTHYVSNGYLVFEPDIYYEMGHPGPSAVKSIVPGVQKLLERGYVDPKGLGLQGQSWGGYQTAYIITQSTMFSGAMAGAPVANMTSAYGGIRWGSGLARAFQYEDGQSRIGQSLFDGLDLYLENSPLFHLERVTTPLFIMSNDQDDAVPWYQGIELFVGMRRLQKEVYLINYNNNVHNPASRANQKDIAMRMEQFFDVTLKKKPAPDWMVHGIPAVDKGKDQLTPPPTTTPQIIRPNPNGGW